MLANLQHTALQLPAPVAKMPGQNAALQLTLTGDSGQTAISAHLDQQVHFSALLQHSSQQLSQAHLSLGPDALVLAQPGFNISLDLA